MIDDYDDVCGADLGDAPAITRYSWLNGHFELLTLTLYCSYLIDIFPPTPPQPSYYYCYYYCYYYYYSVIENRWKLIRKLRRKERLLITSSTLDTNRYTHREFLKTTWNSCAYTKRSSRVLFLHLLRVHVHIQRARDKERKKE